MNKKQGLFMGIAVLLLAAIFTFTGCSDGSDDGGNGDTPTPPPAVTGVTIYTLNGTTLTPYTGTGSVQKVTAKMVGESQASDLGEIGTISAAGKLTLNLPATVEDSKLTDLPASDGAPAGTKQGKLDLSPQLQPYKSDGTNYFRIQYFNKAGSVSAKGETLSFVAGWNYQEYGSTTLVTDISSCKWVITP
jgi:hypothetical protein